MCLFIIGGVDTIKNKKLLKNEVRNVCEEDGVTDVYEVTVGCQMFEYEEG